MNKGRKVELLYKKAKGQGMNATPAELQELRKYRIDAGDANYATKANISGYVSAVDRGCREPFYDWCLNNKKGDRRRKGHSEKAITAQNRDNNISAIFVGWITWGLAIYWMLGGAVSVGGCAIAGIVVTLILYNKGRRNAGFTCMLLPIILAVIFGSR